MKRASTIILRLAILAAGAVVLMLCGVTGWLAIFRTNPSSAYYIWSYV